jgi:hypothetical protein
MIDTSRALVRLAFVGLFATSVAACAGSEALGSVSGYAYACAGSAISAGRQVTVDAYSGTTLVRSSNTDSNHAYYLQLPPGAYVITVPSNAPEGKPAAVHVSVIAGVTSQADFANSCR